MAIVVEVKKVVVDTDILVGHVIGTAGSSSDLRRLLASHFCYTTVFHAIEAFSLCVSKQEVECFERAMSAIKILGLNAKTGKNIGALFGRAKGVRDLHLLAAGVCIESRLPLVSGRRGAYRGIPRLELLDTRKLLRTTAGRVASGQPTIRNVSTSKT